MLRCLSSDGEVLDGGNLIGYIGVRIELFVRKMK